MALSDVPGDAEVFYGGMRGNATLKVGERETDWIPFSVAAIKMATREVCTGYEGPRTGSNATNMDAENNFSELVAIAGPSKQPLTGNNTGPYVQGGFTGFAKWRINDNGMKYFAGSVIEVAIQMFDSRNGIGGGVSAPNARITIPAQ